MILAFLGIILILKMGLIRKYLQILAINICWNPLVEPFPDLETVSPHLIHNSRNCPSKFGVVPTPTTIPAKNYFQSVRRWQNPRVLMCSSWRVLRLGAFDLSI
jgi:hypothetical protein